jgi:HSP20 family protein
MYSTKGFNRMRTMNELFYNGLENLMNADQVRNNDMNVPVNIHEADKAYELQVIAPGLKKEDFKISVEKNTLTVSFEQKEQQEQKEGKSLRSEYTFRSFKRSFTLNDKIDSSAISAKYNDGVLELSLPKKETAAPETHEIPVA